MYEIDQSRTLFPKSTKAKIKWLDKNSASEKGPAKQSGIQNLDLDEKTRRMLEILIKEDFKSTRAAGNMRLRLVFWVLRTKIQEKVKRTFDIGFALFSLFLFSPVILITAIAIKLDSRGPVFYKQIRVGKLGKQFDCYKFRSMVVDADRLKQQMLDQNEADEVVFKMRKDPRVTRVGRLIRKLSIDEMPQILNVLKGDMSIVGPRPCVPIELESYEYSHFYRLDAVPGITGLQQVSGRSDLSFKRWVELDIEYIQEKSLWIDILIILKTIPVVITGKGAY